MATREKRAEIMGLKALTESGKSRSALKLLAEMESGALVLEQGDRKVTLPKELTSFVRELAGEMALGHEVVVFRADAEMSPAEAAKHLGFSRQYVARLLDDEVIPSRHLPGSSHRRIRVDDIVEFQARRDRRRRGVNEIVAALDDAGVEY